MRISDWLDEKEAENVDVAQIELPTDISFDAVADETLFFIEDNPCGVLCTKNHPFSKVERFGRWFYCSGQDKKAGIHSSKMKWRMFTKVKDQALQAAKAHME
jgi:UDP:flavonoid glycosyltransferase YjiC (YdhE family)